MMNERRNAPQYFPSRFDAHDHDHEGYEFDDLGGAATGQGLGLGLGLRGDEKNKHKNRAAHTIRRTKTYLRPQQQHNHNHIHKPIQPIPGHGLGGKRITSIGINSSRNNRPTRLGIGLVRQVTDGSARTPSSTTISTPGSGLSEIAIGNASGNSHSMGSKSGIGIASASASSSFGFRNSSKSKSNLQKSPSPVDHFQFDELFMEQQHQQHQPSLITPTGTDTDSINANAFFTSDQDQKQDPDRNHNHNVGGGGEELLPLPHPAKESTGFDPSQDFLQCTSIEFTPEDLDLFPDANAFASASQSNDQNHNHAPTPAALHDQDQDQPPKSNMQHTQTTTTRDFDIYRFNGLMMDDSTVGTALSQRHLLRNDFFSPQKRNTNTNTSSSGSIRGGIDKGSGIGIGIGIGIGNKTKKSPLAMFLKSSTPRKLKERARNSRKEDGTPQSPHPPSSSSYAHSHSKPKQRQKQKQKAKRSERLEQKMNETQESQEKLMQRQRYASLSSERNKKKRVPSLELDHEDLFRLQRPEFETVGARGALGGILPSSSSSSRQKENPGIHRAQKQYKLSNESMVLNEAGASFSDKLQRRRSGMTSFGTTASSASMSTSPGGSASIFTSGSEPVLDRMGKKQIQSLEHSNFDQNITSPVLVAKGGYHDRHVSMSHDEMSPLVTSRKRVGAGSGSKDHAMHSRGSNRLPSLPKHVPVHGSKWNERIDRSDDLPPLPEHGSIWNNDEGDKSDGSPPSRKHVSKWNDPADISNDLPPLPNHVSKWNKRAHISDDMFSEESTQSAARFTSHDEMSPLAQKQNAKSTNADDHRQQDGKDLFATTISNINFADQSANPEFVEDAAPQTNTKPPVSAPITTPKKQTHCISGTFLDKSWQPSPIKPGGSFAIFDETQIDDSRSSEEEDVSLQADALLPVVSSQTRQESDFMRVVAAIVIQTFFRRHLAYKLTCERYSAVLKIQRFLRAAVMERERNQRLILQQTAHQFYDLAAIQIQAAWRGWWVRDCINVEAYCASTIQRAFRSYWARLNYKFDLYRIIVAQSVVRKYLARSRLCREQKAAILIQSQWRICMAKDKVMNTLADILIVQSVCRRHLVNEKVRVGQNESTSKHHTTLRDNRAGPMSRRSMMMNVPVTHSERTLKSGAVKHRPRANKIHMVTRENVQRNGGDLTQMNTDELIRKWQSRRSRHSDSRRTHHLAEF